MSLFPLAKIDGHRLESKSGIKSFVYEFIPPDLEQMNNDLIEYFIQKLTFYLNSVSCEYFYKIYSLGKKIYLNTNDPECSFPGITLKPSENYFEQLIGDSDFFAKPKKHLNTMLVNLNHWRLINIYELSFTSLLNLQKYDTDFVIFFRRKDNLQSISKLKNKRRLHFSNTLTPIKDIESDAAYAQSEELLEDVIHGKQSIFDTEVWLLLKEEQMDLLNLKTKVLIEQLYQYGIEPLIETDSLSTIFEGLMFGVKPIFKRAHDLTSDHLINFLPLSVDFLMNDGLLLHSQNDCELKLEIFDKKADNYCAIIAGPSGSGKSVVVNKIIKDQLALGRKAIILDLGFSFQKTVNYYGGQSFNQSFNPFQFKDPDYLLELMKSVIPESEMNAKMKGKILRYIKNSLDQKINNFKDFILYLENESGLELRPYFEECWDYLGDEDLSDSDLIYVDTSIYPAKVKSLLLIYLIEYFNHLEGQKIFVFDECWDILKDHGEFLDTCFKTYRKKGAAAIAMTQDLDDFTVSHFGRMIVKNAYHKIIFHQEVKNQDYLDDFDKEKIKSIRTVKGEYSEFYYKSAKHRKIARYRPDETEYEIFTSDEQDNLMMAPFFEENLKYFSFKDTMDKWVRAKYD